MQILLASLTYPRISPFIIQWGWFNISWYSFMYILGFFFTYVILKREFQKKRFHLRRQFEVGDLLMHCFYGVLLGGRIGYILFYNLDYYVHNPGQIIAIWNGGMSFHGGLAGVAIASFVFAKRHQVPYFHVTDHLAMCAPIGLGFGRIGNFINGELYGRVTDVPWAMVFPGGGPHPRHPSQLYESFLEGPVLFLCLFVLMRTNHKDGLVSASLLIGYGLIRFALEFFREPDAQLGAVIGSFSMGQLLSSAMIMAGLLLLWCRISTPTSRDSA